MTDMMETLRAQGINPNPKIKYEGKYFIGDIPVIQTNAEHYVVIGGRAYPVMLDQCGGGFADDGYFHIVSEME